ncbi:MAG: homoserine kinase [Burkholderiales bacterium]|jgi:homoserine kinase|nr:homoserine kinase [Burkholderiales bacterium]
MIKNITQAIAFAPATSANMIVGFDILGFALNDVGDEVTLIKRSDGQIVIDSIESEQELPLISSKNTASIVIQKVCADFRIDCGFSLRIKKGIAIGSGMGGSAASAVAALVAFNHFLEVPLSNEQLVHYALFGEELASGGKHADNVAPCIYGGVTLTRSIDPIDIIKLPTPELQCIVIHPHLVVETKAARGILKPDVAMKNYVMQSANLAGFMAALYTKDIGLLKRSLNDVVIEPQRAHLVPGFYPVKEIALNAGALACSFSGSGPSMFALSETVREAHEIAAKMIEGFEQFGIKTDWWISPISNNGAHVK